jgi:hypothetical protein
MNTISYELSNKDIINVIRRYDPTFSQHNIIEYPDLAKMNINLLLPYENDYKVIFFITGENGFTKSGHWCAIAWKQGKVMWFDPYGLKPDAEEKWLSNRERVKFREDQPILHEIVPKNKLVSNPIDFQSEKLDVNTCGRWVCMFVIYCCFQRHSIQQFHEYIESIKLNSGLSFDAIVVKLIQL